MRERFLYRKRVHLPSMLIRARLNGCLQKVSSGLYGQGIGNSTACAFVVFNPGWMRQSNPHRTSAGQKFYVHGVSVPGCNGNDQGLVNTMQLLPSPAVGSVKIIVHAV